MRRLTILLILITLGVFGLAANKPAKSTSEVRTALKDGEQPIGPIDGAENPELIPDHVAYSLLFRLISRHHTPAENKSTRAYVRGMGLGKQNCKDCQSIGAGDEDINTLIAVADEFERRVGALDIQASELRERGGSQPPPEIRNQLMGLQKQHEALVAETIASLPTRLSPEAMERVAKHVSERMKRKMKIVPGPVMPANMQH